MSSKTDLQKKKAIEKKKRQNTAWLKKQLDTVVPTKELEETADSDKEESDTELFIPIGDKDDPSSLVAEDDEGPTVVYIGHLPFGFEEFQVSDYFKQFGEVRRSFISRSKKTGNSRGYGFVQFENSENAQIAADVMNDYLMFKKKLICRTVPKLAAAKIKWPTNVPEGRSLFKLQRNAAMNYNHKNLQRPLVRLVEREQSKRNKLQKLGINYEFDGYTALVNQLKENTQKINEETKKRAREEEGEEEEVEEEEGKGEEEESEEDEEQVWDKRKKTKLAEDLTSKQKKQILNEQRKANNGKTPTKQNGTKATATEKTPTTPATPKAKGNEKVTPAKEQNTATPKTQGKGKGKGKETNEKVTPAKEQKTSTPAPSSTKLPSATPPAKQQKITPAKQQKTTTPPAKSLSTPKSTPATKSAATPQSKKKKING